MGNRRKNKLDMTITEQLQSMVDTFCDGYCKYLQIYHEKYLHDEYETEDEAQEAMQHEICEHCPFMEL